MRFLYRIFILDARATTSRHSFPGALPFLTPPPRKSENVACSKRYQSYAVAAKQDYKEYERNVGNT